jgi:hypothetical protein
LGTNADTERNGGAQEIVGMDWPTHSADLSPIENIWGFSRDGIVRQYGRGRGRQLIQLAKEVWEDLPWVGIA